jgi:hypothetical protein
VNSLLNKTNGLATDFLFLKVSSQKSLIFVILMDNKAKTNSVRKFIIFVVNIFCLFIGNVWEPNSTIKIAKSFEVQKNGGK